jgi:RNA polymerase sigma factor (sigma-70 family)
MERDSISRTRITLLSRLHDATDQAAWSDFVRHYGRLIYGWCQKWNLQAADAEDLTQNVLVRLAEKMRSFQYDPARSFRAYLKTLAHYAWCDLLASRRKPGAGSGDSAVAEMLQSVEARDDLVRRLLEDHDREALARIMPAVRERVEPRTWEAFRLTALEGLSGAEAAERLGLKVATVFKARSKVQQMLREEAIHADPPSGAEEK